VGGVLRGIAGVLVYLGGLLFYAVRFLLFAILCGALFGGGVYWASLSFSAPGSVTRGLFDAIIVFVSPLIAYTVIREKIRSLGRSAGTHGSARFASGLELRPLGGPSGLLIGRNLQSGKPLRYDGPGHLLTIAPTRTGKGVGTVIPNLLVADRSVICVDPKGENTAVTGRARARFGPVHVLDPFGITGQPSSCFNPLAAFDPSSVDLAEDAATLADALVFDAPGEAGEAHWNEEAKALIAGVLLYTSLRNRLRGAPSRRCAST
jgi:type IV secretion system protein VirD4